MTTRRSEEPAEQDEGPIHWSDLTKGDRIHHFDYGAGTVHASTPVWLFITWDNPNEHLTHHSALLARYLSRLEEEFYRIARPEELS
jgi:hypothetical protein